MRFGWVGVLLFLPAFSGCTVQPTRGDFQKEWNLALRELGINPIFPPREDVQVGDVYVRRGNPNAATLAAARGYVPIDLWVTSLPLRDAVSRFYADERSSFPETPPAPPAAGKEPEDFITRVPRGTADAFLTTDAHRLRQVAFPDFTSVTVRGADLQAFVPLQVLAVAFGAHWQGTHQLSVRIPMAESYGLPAAPVHEALKAALNGPIDESLRLHLFDGLRTWARTDPTVDERACEAMANEKYLYLDAITEVFYARSIEMSISTAKEFGARTRVQPAVAIPGGASQDAFERASTLNEKLQGVDKQVTPGGSVQFIAVSDNSISMRRTYLHPVAIGFRSLVVAVDPETGAIVSAASQGHGQAQTTTGNTAQERERLAEHVKKALAAGRWGIKPDSFLANWAAMEFSVEAATLAGFDARQTGPRLVEGFHSDDPVVRDLVLRIARGEFTVVPSR